MNDWHKFVKEFYRKKKQSDPYYPYKQAMQDASLPYKQFKIEQLAMRKEIGRKIHLIKDPLNYIMPQYLDTNNKITLKLSHDLFSNVRLNNKDFQFLYLENKQKIKREKDDKKFSGIIELRNHLRASGNIIGEFPVIRQIQPINHRRLRQILQGMY